MEHGYTQNSATANELAGKVYLAKGYKRMSRAMMTEACYLYEKWGATAKVEELVEKYSNIITRRRKAQSGDAISDTHTDSNTITRLDMSTIIKVSQAIARIIEPTATAVTVSSRVIPVCLQDRNSIS